MESVEDDGCRIIYTGSGRTLNHSTNQPISWLVNQENSTSKNKGALKKK